MAKILVAIILCLCVAQGLANILSAINDCNRGCKSVPGRTDYDCLQICSSNGYVLDCMTNYGYRSYEECAGPMMSPPASLSGGLCMAATKKQCDCIGGCLDKVKTEIQPWEMAHLQNLCRHDCGVYAIP